MSADKDKKLNIMTELIKSNQKHIEHQRQMIETLKKQLFQEQTAKDELKDENIKLKLTNDQLKLSLSQLQSASNKQRLDA